jgi:hypothetical protein
MLSVDAALIKPYTMLFECAYMSIPLQSVIQFITPITSYTAVTSSEIRNEKQTGSN